MALMILVSGAALCNAAEFPMPMELLAPCALYALACDLFK